MATLVDVGDYRGVLLVTIAYFAVYYGLMMLQIYGKGRARDEFQQAKGISLDEARAQWNRVTDQNPYWVMADRSFLNALEQQTAFLLPLWLHAVFVSPTMSTIMGSIAVVARFFFPVFWSLKGGWNLWVEASTQPYYLAVFYFLGALFALAVFEVNIVEKWPHWSLPLAAVGFQLVGFAVVIVVGKVYQLLTKPGFQTLAQSAGAHAGKCH